MLWISISTGLRALASITAHPHSQVVTFWRLGPLPVTFWVSPTRPQPNPGRTQTRVQYRFASSTVSGTVPSTGSYPVQRLVLVQVQYRPWCWFESCTGYGTASGPSLHQVSVQAEYRIYQFKSSTAYGTSSYSVLVLHLGLVRVRYRFRSRIVSGTALGLIPRLVPVRVQ